MYDTSYIFNRFLALISTKQEISQSILFYKTTELKPKIVLNYMFPQNVLIMHNAGNIIVRFVHTFFAAQVKQNLGMLGFIVSLSRKGLTVAYAFLSC